MLPLTVLMPDKTERKGTSDSKGMIYLTNLVAGALRFIVSPPKKKEEAKKDGGGKKGEASPASPILEKQDGNFDRISFNGYDGRGYVIKDFKKYEGGAIQLLPAKIIIKKPNPIPDGLKNECASLVQYFGIPNTKTWRKGPRVCDFLPGTLPEGTVVATLRDGTYHSDYSGRSHVGIYLSHDDYNTYLNSPDGKSGVWLFDQFNRNKIAERHYFYAVDADKVGKLAKKAWKDEDGIT